MTSDRFSDQDIERLLSGETPEDETLLKLAPLVEMLHAHGARRPTDEQVAQFAAEAARLALSDVPAVSGTAPDPAGSRFTRSKLALRRKLAAGLAAVLLLSGMTGVAVASDDAAPGDPLYGIDRALESIGVGDGGLSERIEEAEALNARDHAAEALAHAREAIARARPDDAEAEDALAGLDQAIAQLNEDLEGEDDLIRQRVTDMLSWMQTEEAAALLDSPDPEPGAFGRGVANLAQLISGKTAEEGTEENSASEADEKGPPDSVPAGPPEDVPAGP